MSARWIPLVALAFTIPVTSAAPSLINQDLVTGIATFDAAVNDAGTPLRTQPLRNLQEGVTRWTFDDFTISASDGTPRFIEDDYAGLRERGLPGALSGWAIGLSVNEPAPLWGLTFDFRQPVNAFGLEVGDWGTCCWSSSLFIAFDGGATQEVGTALSFNDNPGVAAYGRFTNFVGAFDTSGSFSRVSFYGAGVGEYMVGGGTIRYARLPESVDLHTDTRQTVPEPAAAPLALLAVAALWAVGHHARRRAVLWRRRLVQQRLQSLN